MTQLQPGEKRRLSDFFPDSRLRIQVTHDLAQADVSLFGLDRERKLRDDRYFIFYNQLQSPGREVTLNLEGGRATFDLDLSALPASIERLVFVISHDQRPMSQLGQLRLSVQTAQGSEQAVIPLNGTLFTAERALMIAELYRHAGEWRLGSVAQGFQGGLDSLLTYFGGQAVENQSPQPPAPSVPAPAPAPAWTDPAPVPPPAPPPASGGSSGAGGLGTSISDFLRSSAEQDRPGDVFELESSKMLEVKVNGRVWSKLGAMIAYKGRLDFQRASTLSDLMGGMRSGGNRMGALLGAAMRMGSGEMGPLVSIQGQGVCYLADQGKEISIIRLQGDTLNINGKSLLAFEDTVTHEITMQRSMAGMVAGGLFSVQVRGNGLVAILSHGQPLTLRVTPQEPVFTDPNATIAWSDHLRPDLRVSQDLRSMFGRGGGETLQMAFQGNGFVVVQPYEEAAAMEHLPNH
ncbi:AIM24 family protein [Deinococcus betulae]|uniref:AIM24 family protein n=1 Tax=Deinococcus betulae TaxID=2873312 RepID=UPI0034E26CC1